MHPQKGSSRKRQRAPREAVLRAVASSTAIETGESVDELEKRLRSGTSRFKDLPLA